jgi:Cu(I)/Ag(I) efflux system membrane fusion protein
VLSVPEGALIDSGDRRVVIVDKGEGRYEPRPVKIGRRGAGYVEIRAGVSEHENVVTAANFLIDAESNLKGTSNNDDIFARSIAGSSRR